MPAPAAAPGSMAMVGFGMAHSRPLVARWGGCCSRPCAVRDRGRHAVPDERQKLGFWSSVIGAPFWEELPSIWLIVLLVSSTPLVSPPRILLPIAPKLSDSLFNGVISVLHSAG